MSNNYGQRPVIEETMQYTLLGPDISSDPGFLQLEPMGPGIHSIWINRVVSHLKLLADDVNVEDTSNIDGLVTFQEGQKQSFSYRGGAVRVIPSEQRVEISEAHPQRAEVIADLCRLFTQTYAPSPYFHV